MARGGETKEEFLETLSAARPTSEEDCGDLADASAASYYAAADAYLEGDVEKGNFWRDVAAYFEGRCLACLSLHATIESPFPD